MTREEIENTLRERGIEISIHGCGCCGSPEVSIKIDGVVVINEQEEYNFSNWTESQE